jgi:hypothetical protein
MTRDKSCVDLVKEAIGTARRIHGEDILGPYEACILSICERVREAEFEISIISDESEITPGECQSVTDWHFHLIRWHICGASSGLDLIWDLLHELGHIILDKPEKDKLGDPNWECHAWEKGWESAISQYPELSIQRPSFETRGKKCVETYKREWARKHRDSTTPISCS